MAPRPRTWGGTRTSHGRSRRKHRRPLPREARRRDLTIRCITVYYCVWYVVCVTVRGVPETEARRCSYYRCQGGGAGAARPLEEEAPVD